MEKKFYVSSQAVWLNLVVLLNLLIMFMKQDTTKQLITLIIVAILLVITTTITTHKLQKIHYSFKTNGSTSYRTWHRKQVIRWLIATITLVVASNLIIII